MRLVDADKLKEELRVNGLGYQYYMLDNAPTVKAIPIEWLKEWFNTKMNRTLLPRNFEMVCSWMIYDWEKEK